ncbi:helix-turn-helix domain-containing protein [Xanthomarina gelatinilytica]|uniref:helix-turn-helix domain-containing protein n=1 Tax=Xanthomarina gelatinilytica TaxID=1137281 RepID=UPI003AA7D62F
MLKAQDIEFYNPHPALQPYVQGYAHLSMDDSETDTLKKLYPTNYSILSFDRNSRHFDEVNHGEYNYPLCFLGVTDFCRSFTSSPNSLIGVFFKPFGAYSLLGVAQHELTNKGTDLTDMLSGGQRISRQLMDDLFSPEQSIHMIEEWLLQQLQWQRYTKKYKDRIAYACNLIRQSKGTMPINQLCTDLDLSETSLRNVFREYVGISPKTFSRIVKFNLILSELQTNPAPNWQDLVYRFDFFDQTHFIKEFKRCSHCTPLQWLHDNSTNLNDHIKKGVMS